MKRAPLLVLIAALSLVALTWLTGCSKKVTQVDNFYGTSYKIAMESQLYNPPAGEEIKPVEEVAGTVGEKVITRYEGTFEKPAPRTESYSISVGGIEKTK